VEHLSKKLFIFLLSFCLTSKPLNIVASTANAKPKKAVKKKASTSKKSVKKAKSKKKEDRPKGDLSSIDLKVLNANKAYHKKNKDYEYALKWIDRIISVSSDSEEIQKARLEQADLNYLIGEYEKAGSGYKEYFKLYPGSAKAEYAKYRQVASNHYRLNPPDRDQTLTVETTLLAKEYLDKGSYKKYKKEVSGILEAALKALLSAEIEVFESSLKFKNYEGAQRRLDYIKKKYLPELPKSKSAIQDLESSLEQSKKKGKYVQTYKKERKPFLAKWRKKEFKKQF
jgi:outer membrane protein assembly factor BamD (BamD/ComL family)